ncbi:hypothetical protein BJX76DRAFT_363240 [Aspergillus varians]
MDEAITATKKDAAATISNMLKKQQEGSLELSALLPCYQTSCTSLSVRPDHPSVSGVAWMIEQEQSLVRGGILADQCGLEKDLQTLKEDASAKAHSRKNSSASTTDATPDDRAIEVHDPDQAFDLAELKVILNLADLQDKDFNRGQNSDRGRKAWSSKTVLAIDKVQTLFWGSFHRVIADEGHAMRQIQMLNH